MNAVTQNENYTTSFISSLVGGIVAIAGGLTTTEAMAIFGALMALASFVVNTWAVWRRDRREQKAFEAKQNGGDDEAA